MYSPPTRTVQEVIDYVERVFGDESSTQLEAADFIMFINNACDEINTRNRVLKESATINATGGVASYAFPDKRILQVEALLFGTDSSNMQLVRNAAYAYALENLIGQTPNTGEAIPQYWWEWGGRFTLWPTPPDGTIQLDYTVRHQPITSDTSAKLPLPDKYFNDVANRVLQQSYELDEQMEIAQAYSEQVRVSLTAKLEEERTAQRMTYQTITLIDD